MIPAMKYQINASFIDLRNGQTYSDLTEVEVYSGPPPSWCYRSLSPARRRGSAAGSSPASTSSTYMAKDSKFCREGKTPWGFFSKDELLGLDIGSNSIKAVELDGAKKSPKLRLSEWSTSPEAIVDGAFMDSASIVDFHPEPDRRGSR